MTEAIIVAAGRGKRMGGVYKQFSTLAGKQVFFYSVEKFIDFGVNKVVLVVPKEKLSIADALSNRFGESIKVVPGGEKRQNSVFNGFKETSADIILIHDAVRPFLSGKLIERVSNCVEKFGVCAPGIPVRDTIKLCKKDIILWTKSRRNTVQVQTPQGFKRNILKEVMGLVSSCNFTDELAFAEKLNYEVRWVEGDPMNVKITYPEDMNLAKAIADYRWGK